jgi:sensor histidine kinase YesM
MQKALQRHPFFCSAIFQHLVFWISYLGFVGFMYGSYDNHFGFAFMIQGIQLPVLILVAYFNLWVLMPRFLFSEKYIQYALGLSLTIALGGFVLQTIFYNLIPFIDGEFAVKYRADGFFNIHRMLWITVKAGIVVSLTSALKLIKHWYETEKIARSLEHEKLEAELKFLKTQLHPHFLFNTLNNLYALTLKKSDHAPEMVIKLAELMHYMLYESNSREVTLEKELQYLDNYISLEKLRYSGRAEISFSVSGDITGKKVAPMLFLPFIENSFKHGLGEEVNAGWVDIHLRVQEDWVILEVENSRSVPDIIHPVPTGNGNGIGLRNVQRRLDLLYPDRYELKVERHPGTHLALLKLVAPTNDLEPLTANPLHYEDQMSYRR